VLHFVICIIRQSNKTILPKKRDSCRIAQTPLQSSIPIVLGLHSSFIIIIITIIILLLLFCGPSFIFVDEHPEMISFSLFSIGTIG